MNQLEKLIFLEVTNKQINKLPNSSYFEAYRELNQSERKVFAEYVREIHEIWNFINSKPVLNALDNEGVNTIFDYNEFVSPVSNQILQVCTDFELTLKNEISSEFKQNIIKILGIEFYKKHFE